MCMCIYSAIKTLTAAPNDSHCVSPCFRFNNALGNALGARRLPSNYSLTRDAAV